MKPLTIGLTYDLRDDYLAQGFSLEETGEFDSSETIDAIENTLGQLGFVTERIGNLSHLIAALQKKKSWDLVFNIAEGMYGFAREAQVPALLDAYRIPYVFSDPLVLALTLDKALTKRIVRDHGIATAPFAVISKLTEIAALDLPYPVFAKPLAEGTGKGINAQSYIESPALLHTTCEALLQQFHQPVLVETFLPGREFTVGMVGTGDSAKVLGVMEICLRANVNTKGCSFIDKENCEERIDYLPVDDAESQQAATTALAAWRALRCQDGGRIDLRSNAEGVPQFLEVNPLAGLHPTHSDLPILAQLNGYSYYDLLGKIMSAALQRLNLREFYAT